MLGGVCGQVKRPLGPHRRRCPPPGFDFSSVGPPLRQADVPPCPYDIFSSRGLPVPASADFLGPCRRREIGLDACSVAPDAPVRGPAPRCANENLLDRPWPSLADSAPPGRRRKEIELPHPRSGSSSGMIPEEWF